MNISSVGLGAILQGGAQVAAGAARIAQGSASPTGDPDLTTDVVGLQQGSDQERIGAKVVEAGESMTKALLDIFA